MFEQQTFENILSRMLEDISDEIDKREGSVAYDMLAPKAAELAQAYIELDNVLNFGFAATSYGNFLDMKVSEVGIFRRPASKATGSIILKPSSNEEIHIQQGTVVYTDTGVRFLIDENVVLNGEDRTVNIIAENSGISGNVPTNSIINIDLSDVECTNNGPTTGGIEAESDSSLLERYYVKVRTPGISGNKNHYKQWATEVSGIGDAKVMPLWNGEGTVKVVLIDSNKEPVPAAKVEEVFEYIEELRPIGATVTVESAVTKSINMSFTLILEQGALLEDIETAINEKIKEYFKEVAFVEDHVKCSRIGMILLSVEGVIDYSDLLLEGKSANIYLEGNEIPILGTVSVT